MTEDINQWISSTLFTQSEEGRTSVGRCLWIFSFSKSFHFTSLHSSHVQQEDCISSDTPYGNEHSQPLTSPSWSHWYHSVILLKLWKVYLWWVCDVVLEPASPSTAPCQEWDKPREQGDPRWSLELMLYSTQAAVRCTVETRMRRRSPVWVPKGFIPRKGARTEDPKQQRASVFKLGRF